MHFRWSGREFHNFAPFTETAVWANDVQQKGMLQLPLKADLVSLVLCCLVLILQSGSGAASFKHLNIYLGIVLKCATCILLIIIYRPPKYSKMQSTIPSEFDCFAIVEDFNIHIDRDA